MNINEIFASDSGVTTVVDALQKGTRQLVTGLLEPAKQLFLSTIIETKSAPILYVTDSLERAEHVYNLF